MQTFTFALSPVKRKSHSVIHSAMRVVCLPRCTKYITPASWSILSVEFNQNVESKTAFLLQEISLNSSHSSYK